MQSGWVDMEKSLVCCRLSSRWASTHMADYERWISYTHTWQSTKKAQWSNGMTPTMYDPAGFRQRVGCLGSIPSWAMISFFLFRSSSCESNNPTKKHISHSRVMRQLTCSPEIECEVRLFVHSSSSRRILASQYLLHEQPGPTVEGIEPTSIQRRRESQTRESRILTYVTWCRNSFTRGAAMLQSVSVKSRWLLPSLTSQYILAIPLQQNRFTYTHKLTSRSIGYTVGG